MSRKRPEQVLKFAIAAVMAGSPALAGLVLDMPVAAVVIGGRVETPGSYALPIGPFAQDTLPVRAIEGALDQRAYRLDGSKQSTLQLMQPLRDQVTAAGYRVLYDCDTAACGGFDFRYGMDVLPEPQMHVDLGDFRYLAAQKDTAFVGVLVSRSADQGFVQVVTVTEGAVGAGLQGLGAGAAPVAEPVTIATVAAPDTTGSLGDRLGQQGSVALDDLVFASGKGGLEDKDYASLADLAAWLKTHPDRVVTLVGHTDASGTVAGNIALSKQRAASVRSWLITHYGVAAGQVAAQGAGFLAPRASNATPEGRTANRRVEVMLNP